MTSPSMARSALQAVAALRGRASTRRSFASAANYDEIYEAEKWEKITYAGIAACTVYAIYVLSKGHHDYPEPPPYPYLRIRKKDFPWGPDGLLEKKRSEH